MVLWDTSIADAEQARKKLYLLGSHGLKLLKDYFVGILTLHLFVVAAVLVWGYTVIIFTIAKLHNNSSLVPNQPLKLYEPTLYVLQG